MKTVYDWIKSKEYVTISFEQYVDIVDGIIHDILKINMNARCPIAIISEKISINIPISSERTFYGAAIPNTDAEMIRILDEMYQACMRTYNELKYKNSLKRACSTKVSTDDS